MVKYHPKNIKIKRSKTKLEDELPLPNINALRSGKNRLKVSLITVLSSFLIELYNQTTEMLIDGFISMIRELETELKVSEDEAKTQQLINELDEQLLPRVIDYLTSIISRYDDQVDSGKPEDQAELRDTQEKLKFVFNEMLRKSMQLKMGQ